MVAVPISTVGGVSRGYAGGVGEPAWATMAPHLGGEYGVVRPDDWRVTPVTSADRTVSIAPAPAAQETGDPGGAFGYGVHDTTEAAALVGPLPAPGSGSAFYVVVARRNWAGAGGTTEFDWIAATAGGDIPGAPTRQHQPGVIDEQPLALVQVTAGQTTAVVVADLRVWQTNGGAVAQSDKVLQYLTAPGTTVRIGTQVWTRVVGSNGVASWLQRTDTTTDMLVRLWGAGPGQYMPRLRILTGNVKILTDDTGQFSFNLTGEFASVIWHANFMALATSPVEFSLTFGSLSFYRFIATRAGVPLRNVEFTISVFMVGV